MEGTCKHPLDVVCHTCVCTCICVHVQISHGNTARHALEHGDEVLAKICGSIASDEGRHEIAYQKVRLVPYGEGLLAAGGQANECCLSACKANEGAGRRSTHLAWVSSFKQHRLTHMH